MGSAAERLASIKPYLIKFGLVGLSGIAVNEGLLALLADGLGVAVKWAGAVAIECSIISNFILNNFWTWRDRRSGHVLARFLRYQLVTLLAGAVNYGVLLVLTHYGMHHLLANLIGIALATAINFVLNHFWTFARVE
jgi:dolichol-phosphate mannosyltransferase